MLLPALGKAREKAQDTSCKNNMKTIGLAQTLYTSDNDGWIIRSYATEANISRAAWHGILAGYDIASGTFKRGGAVSFYDESKMGTFKCPAEKRKFSKSWNYTHYLSNGYLTYNTGYTGEARHRRDVEITSAASALFAGDSGEVAQFQASNTFHFCFRHGGGDPRMDADGKSPDNGTGAIGRGNFVYMDCHCEGKSLTELNVLGGVPTAVSPMKTNVSGVYSSKEYMAPLFAGYKF